MKLCNKKNFFTTYLLAFITAFANEMARFFVVVVVGYDALVVDVHHGNEDAEFFPLSYKMSLTNGFMCLMR